MTHQLLMVEQFEFWQLWRCPEPGCEFAVMFSSMTGKSHTLTRSKTGANHFLGDSNLNLEFDMEIIRAAEPTPPPSEDVTNG